MLRLAGGEVSGGSHGWAGGHACAPSDSGGTGLVQGFKLMSQGCFRETKGGMQGVHCFAEQRIYTQVMFTVGQKGV